MSNVKIRYLFTNVKIRYLFTPFHDTFSELEVELAIEELKKYNPSLPNLEFFINKHELELDAEELKKFLQENDINLEDLEKYLTENDLDFGEIYDLVWEHDLSFEDLKEFLTWNEDIDLNDLDEFLSNNIDSTLEDLSDYLNEWDIDLVDLNDEIFENDLNFENGELVSEPMIVDVDMSYYVSAYNEDEGVERYHDLLDYATGPTRHSPDWLDNGLPRSWFEDVPGSTIPIIEPEIPIIDYETYSPKFDNRSWIERIIDIFK